MSSSHDIRLWNEVAGQYAEHITGVGDSFYRRLSPLLWKTLGDISGRSVLDLGCGHGWLGEQLRSAGAVVTGIDGSAALLERAARNYPDIHFVEHDLTAGLPQPLQEYHAVVAHMVLMDVPELDNLVQDVRASLVDRGPFVFSILHPSFFSHEPVEDSGERYRRVTGYLDHERRWITSFGGHHHYHRPLSWYFDLLTRHGFTVTALHEPPTLPHHARPESEWTDYERWFATIPTMLAVSCRPAS
ncbi:methyltransferase domain-containing protein [Actinoplanes sp. Pm04-4]|uniref:Methyltransferase domain-containing protein n=1 Tax=Paractinoplanes pyxinae TaxID=2997416 RepID=A0ABT4B9J8_9ACTN|nr:class I SAM-dependent methyltransferase [Actinoplanes pyxinae]MCY1143180.1 methyltransferase domain-containing protein [Actinoplanes pyxinae]